MRNLCVNQCRVKDVARLKGDVDLLGDALNNLGAVLLAQGRSSEASDCFEEVLQNRVSTRAS